MDSLVSQGQWGDRQVLFQGHYDLRTPSNRLTAE